MPGSIARTKSPPIVDLIICSLGDFDLFDFVVGISLFRWAATAMKFLVHPESATSEFSFLIMVYFL